MPVPMLMLPGFDQAVSRNRLTNIKTISIMRLYANEDVYYIHILAGDNLYLSRRGTETQILLDYDRLIAFLVDQGLIEMINPPVPEDAYFEATTPAAVMS